MRPCASVLPMLLLLLFLHPRMCAQDSSVYAKFYSLPDKVFGAISKQSQRAENRLQAQTEKYLQRLARQEHALQTQLWKKDSSLAKELFGDIDARYTKLRSGASKATLYSGRLDSLETSLRFLEQQQLLNKHNNAKATAALQSLQSLQGRFNHANDVKEYLKKRQQFLKQRLASLNLTRQFKKFQKDVYYYREQVDEYRRAFEDPSKAAAKVLELANKIPAFRNFFSKHSMLASMFRLPGNDPGGTLSIAGLQTRASVQQNLLQRFGSGPAVAQALQTNVQAAQSQMQQLKGKVAKLAGGGSDIDMPDFKPNKQRTKSFWNRIELGANVQSVKSNQFFPVTSDVAFTAAYKLNNRSSAGIGASYKLGWGHNFRNIRLTHEGVGIRSFVDVQIKGSFYGTGGFEYNYQQPFNSVQQLRRMQHWQKSGLAGITKVVSVRSTVFKKTRVQLLWDFLSYEQVPRAPAIKFRVGYSF
jgi:hypothetical protein